MTPRLISAFYRCTCVGCGKSIAKGDRVWFAKHYGVRCESCGRHPSDAQPTNPNRRKDGQEHRRKHREPRREQEAEASRRSSGSVRRAFQCEDGVYRHDYSSVGEAVSTAFIDAAQNESARAEVNQHQDAALTGHAAWGNRFTKDRLLASVAEPPASIVEAVDEMRQTIIEEVAVPHTSRRRRLRNLEFGDEIDADQWLRRDPACWERSSRDQTAKRTVTIGVNVTVHCGQNPENLLYRGAAATALADVLSERGFNVGIVLFYSAGVPTSDVGHAVTKCVVKEHDMPLDLGAAAFALSEIAFARCVMICGSMRHLPGKPRGGWGHMQHLPAEDRKGLDFIAELNIADRASAVEWVKMNLARAQAEAA
jgi:hypothetical protein